MNKQKYNRDLEYIVKQNENEKRFSIINNEERYCFLDQDKEEITETEFDKHYVYHLAWASRVLAKIMPKKHIDISSKFDWGTIISAFIPFEYYEFRPMTIKLNSYESKKADILNLPFEDNSIESISSLHVVEHIGLGRYGDQIDYDGDIKAINELQRVTKINGNILYVVPIGNQSKIFFNAHRIYLTTQVLKQFGKCELQEFCFINEKVKMD